MWMKRLEPRCGDGNQQWPAACEAAAVISGTWCLCFIWLHLGCSARHLPSSWHVGFLLLLFLHVGSLVAVCEFLAVARAIWLPDQELNLGPYTGRTDLSHWATRQVPGTRCWWSKSPWFTHFVLHLSKVQIQKETVVPRYRKSRNR